MLTRLASIRREQSGFTLIELMVVVAIIALLTTVAVPWLSEATRRAKGSVGKTDLYTYSGAMERVYLDEGTYPYDLTEIRDNKKYVRQSTTFENRFGNPYILITNGEAAVADGDPATPGNQPVDEVRATWYILVDPGNATNGAILTITCADSDGKSNDADAEIDEDDEDWTYNVKLNTSAAPQLVGNDTTAYTPGAGEPAFISMTNPRDGHASCAVSTDASGFDANSATAIRN